MEQEFQQRQIAYKINLTNIHNNELIKQEGWKPNYIFYGSKKISRVNIFGTVIDAASQEQDHILIDDGEANIMIRKFETQNIDISKFQIGTIINVIGRIREYNNQKYILPEIIIKKNNIKWLELNKKQISFLHKIKFYNKQILQPPAPNPASPNAIIEETIVKTSQNAQSILQNIKQLDTGEGAEIELIIKKYGTGTEKVIQTLLEQGEIFTTKPGKVKVLE